MTLNFDKYALTGKTFVRKVAVELGDENDISKASRILRATLHVLRDQSTPEESVQFISQLPMFIKSIYVDGWALGSNKNRVRRLEDFVVAVGDKAGDDEFAGQEDCLMAIQAVFRVIREYVSEGEIEDLRRTVPEELKQLFL